MCELERWFFSCTRFLCRLTFLHSLAHLFGFFPVPVDADDLLSPPKEQAVIRRDFDVLLSIIGEPSLLKFVAIFAPANQDKTITLGVDAPVFLLFSQRILCQPVPVPYI
jgi:hypothetical protein